MAVRALGGAPGAPPGAASVTYMNMYTLTYVDVIRYSVTEVVTRPANLGFVRSTPTGVTTCGGDVVI